MICLHHAQGPFLRRYATRSKCLRFGCRRYEIGDDESINDETRVQEAKCCLIQSVSAKLAMPGGVDASGHLSIRLEAYACPWHVSSGPAAFHIIQHGAAVGKAALED